MRSKNPNFAQEFMIGQIVTLRSGGPQMTIKSLRRAGAVCIWFDRTDRLCEAEFELEHLVHGKTRNTIAQRIALPPLLSDSDTTDDEPSGRLS